MKIRCVTNRIRFRLRKSDIKSLKENQEISEHLDFPNGSQLKFCIEISDFSDINYLKNGLVVSINRDDMYSWIESRDVGLTFEMKLQKEKTLLVLIEKDFPCKHTGEDFEDTFHELQPVEHIMFNKLKK